MKNFGIRAPIAVAAFLLATATVAASKPITLDLKLPGKPPFPKPAMSALVTAGPISLVVADARQGADPTAVGAQREKGADVYYWRTKQSVAPTVAGFVTQLLKGWSVSVTPEAEFGLRVDIMSYYVNENSVTFGSTYVANVRLQVALIDRTGGALWTGEVNGEAKQSGADARPSTCNETLSVALRQALAKALASMTLETASPSAKAPTATPLPAAAPSVIEPEALFVDLTRLKSGGVADDVIVAYVEQRKLSRPLSVDEILRWKDAGIPDAAIKAATRP